LWFDFADFFTAPEGLRYGGFLHSPSGLHRAAEGSPEGLRYVDVSTLP
jgi:hypothetical protein